VVSPKILGWSDDASALDHFDLEVYRLRAGSSGALQQLAEPERKGTVTPDLNNFQFTAPQPGVYAVVVTVYDGANNSARARKIFNFNDQPGFTVTDEPVYIKEADPKTNYSFITTPLDNPSKLTLTWAGRFTPTHTQIEQTSRVERWPIDQYSIDDVYGTTFGLRSIREFTIKTVIYCNYVVDPRQGGRGFEDPQTSPRQPEGVYVGNCSVNEETQTAVLDLEHPLRDGDTVVVWLTISDYQGAAGSNGVKIKTTLDLTRPNVSEEHFVKKRDDKYESL